jgi:cytochrome c peroxidase
MKKSLFIIIFSIPVFLFLTNCTRDKSFIVREETIYYDDETKALKWLDLSHDFTNNEIKLPIYLKNFGLDAAPSEDQFFALGRVLFYDKNLSKDRTIACASCHLQAFAFADTVAFSIGVAGRRTQRNSLALNNQLVANNDNAWPRPTHFFWDNRANSIADQTRETFANPHEMDMSMPDLLERIKAQEYYPFLWKQKFGHFEPKETEVLQAITHFVNAIGTYDSRFDKSLETLKDSFPFGFTKEKMMGRQLPLFTDQENRGKDVFMLRCASCHSPNAVFAEIEQANTGLDLEYTDRGIANLTNKWSDEGVFKTPSLRNIEFTAPYMHDGRFKTLDKVVEFYSDSVQSNSQISSQMFRTWESWGIPGFRFTIEEKQDLVAFLKTLSDVKLRTEECFSSPFLIK